MSANASRVMAQIMGQSTPNWDSAVAKMANVAIRTHLEKQKQQHERWRKMTEAEQRQTWTGRLHGGATIRELAAEDASILSDTDFLKSWQSTAPRARARAV